MNRDKRLLYAVAYTITAVWAASVTVAMFNPHYAVPTSVQGIMGILASYLFIATEVIRRNGGGGPRGGSGPDGGGGEQ
jgi:hypothetical protein